MSPDGIWRNLSPDFLFLNCLFCRFFFERRRVFALFCYLLPLRTVAKGIFKKCQKNGGLFYCSAQKTIFARGSNVFKWFFVLSFLKKLSILARGEAFGDSDLVVVVVVVVGCSVFEGA